MSVEGTHAQMSGRTQQKKNPRALWTALLLNLCGKSMRGIHRVACSPLKWLGLVLTGWFPLSPLLQRGLGNMPVMWDSYISSLDQVDSFFSFVLLPVVNQQS